MSEIQAWSMASDENDDDDDNNNDSINLSSDHYSEPSGNLHGQKVFASKNRKLLKSKSSPTFGCQKVSDWHLV